MKYIECPEVYIESEKSIFIAGGISGCYNWQNDLVKLLEDADLTLLNPRRKNFDINNPDIEEEQIKWEHEHLRKASAVSFWFSPETVCPITLFELGKLMSSDKKIFVGIHPDYARRRDVEIQTLLERPEIKIVYSLNELAEQIRKYLKPCHE